jgi:hypothetical protein
MITWQGACCNLTCIFSNPVYSILQGSHFPFYCLLCYLQGCLFMGNELLPLRFSKEPCDQKPSFCDTHQHAIALVFYCLHNSRVSRYEIEYIKHYSTELCLTNQDIHRMISMVVSRYQWLVLETIKFLSPTPCIEI